MSDERTNRIFAQNDDHFRTACEAIDIEPSARQASKFRRKMGRAYTEGRVLVEATRAAREESK